MTGTALAERLRKNGVECEFADTDDLVLMITLENPQSDLDKVFSAIGLPGTSEAPRMPLPLSAAQRVMSIREAFFAPHESVPAAESEGRICAAPTVACPPAIPIAVSGEVISAEMAALFNKYGVENVEVIKQSYRLLYL
jgi:arginine/lysine/ornithine decarboxylase